MEGQVFVVQGAEEAAQADRAESASRRRGGEASEEAEDAGDRPGRGCHVGGGGGFPQALGG